MVEAFSENGVIIPENIAKSAIEPMSLSDSDDEVVLWSGKSDFHDINVCENKCGRFLKYGLSVQAGKINAPSYKGNIPYLNYFLLSYLLNKNIKKILVLGFGIGLLVNQFEELFPNLERVDAVDIEENILFIAENYFDFKKSEKFSFYLQDALVYLRENKTKYDLIITDIAGNEGIDERFFEDEFFTNIKKSLKKDGIFMFNSCANTDFKENDSDFYGCTVKKYKEHFKNFAVFNGFTSCKEYFKSIYGIDCNSFKIADVTNAIFLVSDILSKNFDFKNISDDKMMCFSDIGVEIKSYLNDLHKIYK